MQIYQKMKTFHILIYGCQMNYSDSARIKAILTNCWMAYVDNIESADIVIFDTCSVRQKSEEKIFGKLMLIRPEQKVWMTGCMIQHNLRNTKINKQKTGKISKNMTWNFVGNISTNEPQIVWFGNFEEELKTVTNRENVLYINTSYNPLWDKIHNSYNNVELFFRIDDTWFLPYICHRLWYQDIHIDPNTINEYNWIIPHDANQLLKENLKTAFVPISTGCNQFCAYCIVPYARWLEKNRLISDILAEVRHHISLWICEIVLLWQIVNKHPDFVQICKEILAIDWIKWLRYTSPYPTYYTAELLQLHQDESKMCPHIHMPLQSGSTNILKKMFRGYDADQYHQFVDNIRWLSRKISITSDIIVWFCDESDEDFAESVNMIDFAKFDQVYIGMYSPRPGTIAAKKYIDNISRETKKSRRDTLNNKLISISKENNTLEVWSNREVIINAKLKNDKYIWYADNMKNVVIDNPWYDLSIWQFVNVNIYDCEAFKLFAKVV